MLGPAPFYSEVLGGQVVLEENPCIVKLANSWVLMNPGGPPTPDKPDISVVNYEPGSTVSSFMNLRVADIQACYEQWRAKGAEFVTPPIDRRAEIRCYMRDPDGYLIEVGQATGVLRGSSPRSDLKTCPAKGDGRSRWYGRGLTGATRRVEVAISRGGPVCPKRALLETETFGERPAPRSRAPSALRRAGPTASLRAASVRLSFRALARAFWAVPGRGPCSLHKTPFRHGRSVLDQ